MTQGFDVFINNAYSAPGQLEMLKMTVGSEKFKHVVNIGSYVTRMTDQERNTDPGWLEYADHDRETYLEQKTLQENWIHEARKNCKTLITTVNPGYMKTNLINDPSTDQALSLADVSSAVLLQISLAEKNVLVPDMDIIFVSN